MLKLAVYTTYYQLLALNNAENNFTCHSYLSVHISTFYFTKLLFYSAMYYQTKRVSNGTYNNSS